MKTNFKLDTVEVLVTNLLESIESHQLYEKELQKSEPYAVLLGYNRQKVKLIQDSLKYIKNYINSPNESDTGV